MGFPLYPAYTTVLPVSYGRLYSLMSVYNDLDVLLDNVLFYYVKFKVRY